MLLTTGPVEMTARTTGAMARPILHHHDPLFLALFERTCAMLQRVFTTEHDVVILQGEAMLGLEAAAASLIAPGDRVLNLVSGIYGKGYETFIRRAGGEAVELAVPYDEAIDPQAVRDALRRDPHIRFLSVVHGETPSGTRNPLAEICRVARSFEVVTIADVVATLGSEPLRPDADGVDVAVAGSQKCLGAAPGLAPIAIGPRAWEIMERRRDPLRGSYLSLLDWRDAWIARRRFPHAPSVTLVYALESALEQLLEEGVDRCIARHASIARACRAGVRALGLRTWAAREEIAANAATAIAAPEGRSGEQIVDHLRERYGVAIAGGEGEMAGRLFRIGHMAGAARPPVLAAALAILERTLHDLGYPVAMDSGAGAAMAALER